MAAFQKAIDAIDRTTSLIFTDSSQPIQITVGDLSGVSISVGGNWTGAIAFEGSVSGTSWSAIKVYSLSDNSESATITATGHYGINPTPFSQIRIVPTVASGSALVELLAVKTSSFNWLSAIWKLISDRIPVLSNGKIPVDVASLNVTVSNASLEIANDVGNPVPVSAATPWFTKSNTYFETYTIAKNAEAVAYTAGDVYGTRFELTNFGVANGSFFLTGVNLVSSLSSTTVPSGMGLFSLFLFDSEPTLIADNAAFTLASSSITPQGIPLNSLSLITNATNSTSQTSQINELFRRGSSTLYGYLVTQSAFTPTNSAASTMAITLKAIEA